MLYVKAIELNKESLSIYWLLQAYKSYTWLHLTEMTEDVC